MTSLETNSTRSDRTNSWEEENISPSELIEGPFVTDPSSNEDLEGQTSAVVDIKKPVQSTKRISEQKGISRIVPRDLPFHQSSNKLRISSALGKSRNGLIFGVFSHDWFHILLRYNTVSAITVLLSVWSGVILCFAGIYMAIDNAQPEMNCGLGEPGSPIPFGPAFAFSLETCTTVGYGLPSGTNAFFENCPDVQVAIYFQMVFSMMFNAFLFAFFYARLSRCDTRGSQMLFGNRAVIRKITTPGGRSRYTFEVRVFDADCANPVVEAHVRMYAVKRPSSSNGTDAASSGKNLCDVNFDFMRVAKPNDELGGMLFTSAPSSVVHHIDFYSPIVPQELKGPENGTIGGQSGFVLDDGGIELREADSYNGGRDGLTCMVCGESYGSRERLMRHVKFQQMVEAKDGYPVEGSHQSLDLSTMFMCKRVDKCASGRRGCDIEGGCAEHDDFEAIRAHLTESNIEILVVVEGIDPLNSGTFQSVQSYTLDDVVFGGRFGPCVTPNTHKGGNALNVDMDAFHDVLME